MADADLSCEDVLMGYPGRQRLEIDALTLLERHSDVLDGTGFSSVEHPSWWETCGSLGRLMIARLYRVHGKNPIDNDATPTSFIDPNLPRGNYSAHKYDIAPFYDTDMMSLEDDAREEMERADIAAMLTREKHGFSDSNWPQLEAMIWEYAEPFSTRFSSTPKKVPPLLIELTDHARSTRVRLRHYSPSQWTFMATLIEDFVKHNLVYPNPSSKWACAPLFIPNPEPSQWIFTVDLRPLKRYKKPYLFPLPRMEHELTKAAASRYYANFDFTHHECGTFQ